MTQHPQVMKHLTLSIAILLCYGSTKAVTLVDAIKQKLVTAEVIGNDATNKDHYVSAHSGQCMHLILKNISTKTVDILVETGQEFLPDDDGMQPMIVTKHQNFQLLAKAGKDGLTYAMCFNAGKSSPGTKSGYKVGPMATGALLLAAQYVEKNNLQDWQGQGLVWDAVGRNCFDCLFVSEAAKPNQPRRPSVRWDSAHVYHDREVDGGEYHKLSPDSVANIFKNWYTKVDVKLTYVLHEPSKISVQLVDEKGKIIKDVIVNEQQQPGSHDVHETLVIDNDWKLKKCKLYLYVNGKIMLDKEVRIKAADGVSY